jgi:hypothetical protein
MTLSIFGLGTPIEYPLRERKDLISLGSPLESQVNAQYSLVKLVIDIPDRRGILTAHRRRFGMKNPVYKKIQDRNVKSRLRMLQDAQRVSGNVRQTCRFFGVSRTHFYIWKSAMKRAVWLVFGICHGVPTGSDIVFPLRSLLLSWQNSC